MAAKCEKCLIGDFIILCLHSSNRKSFVSMIYFANGTVMIDFSSNKTNRSFTIDKIVTILAKSLKTIVQTKIDFFGLITTSKTQQIFAILNLDTIFKIQIFCPTEIIYMAISRKKKRA